MTDQDVIEDYFSTLTSVPRNTKRLFAIGFIGLPGTGKTTVARELSDKLGLPYVSNDDLRRHLNNLGFDGHTPRQDLVRIISEARTEWFYRHKTSVVVDADFSERREVSEDTAVRNHAKLLLIKTMCAEDTALHRIGIRISSPDPNEASRGDTESYFRGKLRHEAYPAESVFVTIDTDQAVGRQIDAVVEQMRKDDFIA